MWKRGGQPLPPPHAVKQTLLRQVARTLRLRVLVGTGTYEGDMVEAMKGDFDRIYSIEISEGLAMRARGSCRRS